MLTDREEMIVRLLRHTADGFAADLLSELWEGDEDYPEHAADVLRFMADRIEAGEHLKRPDPTIAAETWMKEGNLR